MISVARDSTFWSQVAIGSPHACWNWKGPVDKDGYGYLGRVRAHRFAWEMTSPNSQGADVVVRHLCNNPSCCNPSHLVAGTPAENVMDRVKSARNAKGDQNGRSKIKEADALKIYRAQGSLAEIGNTFGVSKWSVRDIKNGKNWGWLTGHISTVEIKLKKSGNSANPGGTMTTPK